MQRRYEVFIEGRPLIIGDTPAQHRLEPGMEQVHVHDVRDLQRALALLRGGKGPGGLYIHGSGAEALWEMLLSEHVFVQAAGGAVVDEGGRLLVIKRLGKWDLPKGKVDRGEGIEAAALREVNEECGLVTLRTLQPLPTTWHTYERKGRQHLKRTDWYLMQGSVKDELVPQHDEDIQEVRWMDRDEVEAMKDDTYPSLLPVIAAWEAWRARS